MGEQRKLTSSKAKISLKLTGPLNSPLGLCVAESRIRAGIYCHYKLKDIFLDPTL